MEPGFSKIFAVERARDIYFALVSTADGADVATDSRTMPPGAAGVADSAQFRHEHSSIAKRLGTGSEEYSVGQMMIM
jgi:hypothetical protein